MSPHLSGWLAARLAGLVGEAGVYFNAWLPSARRDRAQAPDTVARSAREKQHRRSQRREAARCAEVAGSGRLRTCHPLGQRWDRHPELRPSDAQSAARRRQEMASDLRFSATISFVALVAQGIERRFPKPCVAGSNPAEGAPSIRGLRPPCGWEHVRVGRVRGDLATEEHA